MIILYLILFSFLFFAFYLKFFSSLFLQKTFKLKVKKKKNHAIASSLRFDAFKHYVRRNVRPLHRVWKFMEIWKMFKWNWKVVSFWEGFLIGKKTPLISVCFCMHDWSLNFLARAETHLRVETIVTWRIKMKKELEE